MINDDSFFNEHYHLTDSVTKYLADVDPYRDDEKLKDDSITLEIFMGGYYYNALCIVFRLEEWDSFDGLRKVIEEELDIKDGDGIDGRKIVQDIWTIWVEYRKKMQV